MKPYAAWIAVVVAACAGDPEPVIGQDTTVVAFDDEWVHFGDPNTREVDRVVTFPAAGQRFERVMLTIALACPAGGCDWWDRLGHLAIVDGEERIELARFITPYRLGGEFTVDVTDLQRLLEGEVTLRVFIDTWVGPGHANGEGWLVDATFAFEGGLPTPDPFAVVPVWGPHGVVYGDPARPTLETASIEAPAGATGARLRALITGHGQGNAENCAEFCAREHTFEVGGEAVSAEIWRDDCPTTAVPDQQGTWEYPRAGWCPGAMVEPWIEDVAAAAGPLEVTYDVATYENTCRPDATTCTGCVFNTGCAYNDSSHTEPRYEQSALLIFTR